jgi:DNA-binding transcriptional LysR family regulator
MFPMHLIAIIPRAHPLFNRTALEVPDLVREALLLTPPGTGSRVLLDQVCQAEGLNLRDVRMESRAYSALVAMSEAGCGVAVTLSTVSVSHPGLKVVPIQHRGKPLGIWFAGIWHRRRDLPPYARAFVTTAKNTTRINYPGKHYGFAHLPV